MFSKQDIEKYFLAEKQLGLVFIVIGILAILLAIVFFLLLKTAFYKGAAIPLLVIGLIQLIAGSTVYNRSDADRIRNVYAYDMNPGQLKNDELPRMLKVNKNFAVLKWVEIVLLAAGLAMAIYYRANIGMLFWCGFGLLLAMQAVIMFVADFTAEKRAISYTKGIESFVKKA